MLGGRAREVDPHGVVVDLDRDADRQQPVCGLEEVLGLVASVGHAANPGPHDPLRVGEELGHRGHDAFAAATRAELLDPAVGETVGRQLRAQVAASLRRAAHLRDERLQGLLVEQRRRDHDALVRERARPRWQAARLAAADVDVVRPRDREAEERPRDGRQIGQMRPTRVRVVEDPDLAGLRVAGHHGGHGLRHRAEVDRDVLGLRDHPALLVEQRRRAVVPLLDVRGERAADQHRSHLLGDRDELGADHLKLDGDHRNPSEPQRSERVGLSRPAGRYPARRSLELDQAEGRERLSGGPRSSSGGPGRVSAVRTATSSICRARSA